MPLFAVPHPPEWAQTTPVTIGLLVACLGSFVFGAKRMQRAYTHSEAVRWYYNTDDGRQWFSLPLLWAPTGHDKAFIRAMAGRGWTPHTTGLLLTTSGRYSGLGLHGWEGERPETPEAFEQASRLNDWLALTDGDETLVQAMLAVGFDYDSAAGAMSEATFDAQAVRTLAALRMTAPGM